MKYLSNNFIPKILICVAAAFLICSCSRAKPTTKPTPPIEASIEQVHKEQPPEAAPPAKPKKEIPSKPKETPASISPPPSSTPKVIPAPPLRITQVIWTSANIREGPGMNYKVVGNIKKGMSLKILEVKGNWLHVQLDNGTEAWVIKTATTEAPKAPPPASVSKPLPM